MIFPPFDQVETWIFDLDNTLYPPHELLFRQIEARISTYVQRELGIGKPEADSLRRRYWHDHGATLAGLMIHHKIDPDPFLDEVHSVDFSVLTPDPRLRAAIVALPGRKIVYTNGAETYAHNVLGALGLTGVFERVWSIEHAFYTPKPYAAAYTRIFGADGLDPARAAFFEDDPRNLEHPHGLGTVTVLVRPAPPPGAASRGGPGDPLGPARSAADQPEGLAAAVAIAPPPLETPDHVDYVTPDLADFLGRLADPLAPPPPPAHQPQERT
jgi:putative hydrolase of the HAD superfamily